jgi:hypothetical protein
MRMSRRQAPYIVGLVVFAGAVAGLGFLWRQAAFYALVWTVGYLFLCGLPIFWNGPTKRAISAALMLATLLHGAIWLWGRAA